MFRRHKKKETHQKNIKFVKQIYDPIHGYIEITEPELAIIDTPIFQRLRGIKQLGPVDYVYPTATHTRFSHSLGAMEVASKMFNALLKRNIGDIDLSPDDEELIRLAMLLHDVGHPPFSHVLEFDTEEGRIKHENFAYKIILKSEIADILNNYGYDPKEIVNILKINESRESKKLKKPELSLIVSSVLDADKLDYLARDAYFTGVRYGLLDIDRILMVLTVIEVEGGKTWAILEKGVPAIESMIIGRYHMFRSVYYHKTVGGFEVLLRDTCRELITEGILENPVGIINDENWALWSIYDDNYLLNLFRANIRNSNIDKSLREKMKMFLHRKPLGLVLEGKIELKVVNNNPIFSPNMEAHILIEFKKRVGKNKSKTLDKYPQLSKWTFLYEPTLAMVKEYFENIDFLYVIKRNADARPIIDYSDSVLNELIRAYKIRRLYTQKGQEDLYKEELNEIENELKSKGYLDIIP